jgi:hypothetical protein
MACLLLQGNSSCVASVLVSLRKSFFQSHNGKTPPRKL